MEKPTGALSLGSGLLAASLKSSKLTELRAILGRMLALSFRAQFCITFSKSLTFIYVYNTESLQARIVCELVNSNFFEVFTINESVITYTTAALKELYWFLGLNAPVVVFFADEQAQSFELALDRDQDARPASDTVGMLNCKLRLRSVLSLLVCDHYIEGSLQLSVPFNVHKLIPRIQEEKCLLLQCRTNALEQLEAFNKNYYFMLPTKDYLSASIPTHVGEAGLGLHLGRSAHSGIEVPPLRQGGRARVVVGTSGGAGSALPAVQQFHCRGVALQHPRGRMTASLPAVHVLGRQG